MTTDRHEFNTPVGRFISGSMTEKRTTDLNNRPIDPDKQRFEFGVAFAKTDQATIQLITDIAAYARNAYAQQPHIAQRVDMWMQTFNGFSMKISDGDMPNARGDVNPNSAGHYVIWFSTGLDIRVCKDVGNNQLMQITPEECKRGFFVQIAGNCVTNGLLDHNAGLYMNPEWVKLIAEGDQIVGGRSAEDAFAGAAAPTALPPGARPLGTSAPAPALGAPAPALGAPAPAPNPIVPGGLPAGGMPPVAGTPAPVQGQPALGVPVGGQPQTAPPTAGFPTAPGTASPSSPQHPPHPGILGGLPGQ